MTLVGSLIGLPVEVVRVGPADRGHAIARLREYPEVVSVQPDTIESAEGVECPPTRVCSIPDDPGFPYQWYLYNAPGVLQSPGSGAPTYGADVDAPLAWSRTLGSDTVRIAIIDTGIDASQPDLAGKVIAAANFTASDTTSDLAGHGTHVAGIAAASFDNAVGIAGVAPSARLMDVKVLAVDGRGSTTGDCADVADGIVWAVNHGANVLNLSLGSPSPCDAMALAIDYAFSHGSLVVAAAGNDGSTSRFYPAAYEHVISVGASDSRDDLASFSNRGADWVDVAAPGVGIVSTLPTYDNATGALGYGYLSGTSMAAPIVSGIAALIWGQMPAGQRNREVQERIFSSAQPITGTGSDWRYGRVDACLAVTADPSACSPQPPAATPMLQPPATPIVEQPASAPAETALPAPIEMPGMGESTPGAGAAVTNAAAGSYVGSLGRRGGPLRLTVADGGNALIHFEVTVRLRCRKGVERRVRVSALSATDYSQIGAKGTFRLGLARGSTALRSQRIWLTGSFDASRSRASGTLRVAGHARRSVGRCDSHTLRWHARLSSTSRARAAPALVP